MMDETSTRQLLLKVLNNECWSLRDDFRLYQLMERLSTELNQNVVATDNSLKEIILDLFLGKVSLCTAANKIFGLQTRQFVESGILEDYCSVLRDEANLPEHNNKSEIHYKPEQILAETVASGIEVLEKVSQQNALISSLGSFSENERMKPRAIDPYGNYVLPKIVGSKEWRECTHKKMTVPSQSNTLLDLPVLPSSTEVLDAFSAPEEIVSKPLPKVVRDPIAPTKNNLIITSKNDPGTYYGDQNKTSSIFSSDAITAHETHNAKVDVIKCNPPALKKGEVDANNSSQDDQTIQSSARRPTVLYNDEDHDSFMEGIQANSSLPSGLFANIMEDAAIAKTEIEKQTFTRNSSVSSDISSKAREEKQSQEKLKNYKHDGYENKFEEKDHIPATSALAPQAENNRKDPLFALFFDEPPPDDFDIIFKNPKPIDNVKNHVEFINDPIFIPKQNEQIPHSNNTQIDQSLTDQWFYDTNDFASSLDNNTSKRSDNLFYEAVDTPFGFSSFSDTLNSVESERKCSPPPLFHRQAPKVSNQNERLGGESEIRATRDNDSHTESLNRNKTLISVCETEILPNLTKDRPRIQANRRPPTRRGRKRSYLRSLEEVDSHNRPEDSLSKILNAAVKDEDVCTISPPNLEQKKIPASYCDEELYSNSPSNDDWLLQNRKGVNSDVNQVKADKKSVSLFFDDPESDEYLFNAIQKPSSVQPKSLAKSSKSNQTLSLFNSDDEDDLFLVERRKVES